MPTNLSRLSAYGRALNTHDLLKITAILLMVIDHVGWYLLHDNSVCRLLGRASAPIFFFLIGFSGKVHMSVYIILYGIILSITTGLINHHFWINILPCFIFIHYLFHFFPIEKLTLEYRLAGGIFLLILNPLIYGYVEYGTLGILLSYSARSIAIKEKGATLWLGGALLVFGAYQILAFTFFKNTALLTGAILLFVSLYAVFSNYQLRSIQCPKILLLPLLVLSRYSLHVYFYHVIFLQALQHFYSHYR